MITISILGLDQFVVGHYSKEHTANIAQLCESSEDLINFYAPNSMVFHNGVEQTSWNTIVIVRAPKQYEAVEKDLADYLLRTLSDFSINIELTFQYYDSAHHYQKVNDKYPRYIASDNIDKGEDDVPFEFGDEPEQMEGDIIHDHDHCDHDHCHHDHDHEAEPDVYLGNAFEGFEERMAEAEGKHSK